MRRSLLAVALALSCGGGAATRPSGGRDETPSWLAEGTGAFRAEGQKRLQGVGVASGVADPRSRRRQADAAAREQLQVAVDALAQGLPGRRRIGPRQRRSRGRRERRPPPSATTG